jgi:hypothetical protein
VGVRNTHTHTHNVFSCVEKVETNAFLLILQNIYTYIYIYMLFVCLHTNIHIYMLFIYIYIHAIHMSLH